MATEPVIANMFRLFGEIWPREAAAISPTTVQVYSRVLADVEDDLLKAGIVHLLSEATFWPKPAEVRRSCLRLVQRNERTAGEAWAMVGQYLNLPQSTWIGGRRYRAKPLPDDVQRAVDAVGGISYLRQSADVVADRARFLQAYEAMRTREQEHARMLPEVRQVVQRLGPAPALVEAGE